MTALTPTDAASCRAMAVECGRRANELVAIRQYAKAGKELARASKLAVMALEFEQEEQVSARGTSNPAGQAAEVDSSPISVAADSNSLSPLKTARQTADTAGAGVTASAGPILMKHRDIQT